ncbi:MAG TPA: HNH endonuclease [Ktedonobacteraceae bacterium]|nr:HNH endonuclease [Ktedonobacteraceae bacterium]
MAEAALQVYLDLHSQQIRTQLIDILARDLPLPGKRQGPFNAVETLLCYGLFSLVDPHHYGGANIDQVPQIVSTLAIFFRRTPGSITSKMLNLDGSRQHSAREEPLLFAYLASQPEQYATLYRQIMEIARDLTLGEEILPDFLHTLITQAGEDDLLGQDDLPEGSGLLLAGAEKEIHNIEQTFRLGELLTEKLVERKIRLTQHRFAQEVFHNCGRTCVFCGFAPHTLPNRSGLLRASHIKPWAVSDQRERVDVHNGLVACPLHDAAFDQGYLTIDDTYHIKKAMMLRESIEHDYRVAVFFEDVLNMSLLLPSGAKMPARQYLEYHQRHCFRG